MKKDFVFFINLFTEDPLPPYQVRWRNGIDDTSQPWNFMPANMMPLNFSIDDKITFSFHGKPNVTCQMFIRPMDDLSLQSGSPIKKGNEEPSWTLDLNPQDNGHEAMTSEVFIASVGIGAWRFKLAGTFKGSISTGDIEANSNIIMPFMVDPEVVVGPQ